MSQYTIQDECVGYCPLSVRDDEGDPLSRECLGKKDENKMILDVIMDELE